MVNDLDFKGSEFPVSKNKNIEQKKDICINVFCYENDLVYPAHISKQKFEDCIDLLLINNESKSHYFYIKDFNRLIVK